jgi:hypothetical protein
MSWEGGVDLVALTAPGAMPNVIVHTARMVHTPVGSAPAGMILWQPNPAAPPAVMGFVSPDLNVARYFGPNIFAGTPFESAPALQASIAVQIAADSASARVSVGAFTFEARLSALGGAELIHRAPAAMPPFFQQGLERTAAKAELLVNGEKVSLIFPPVGISGGPAVVVAPCGIYAR